MKQTNNIMKTQTINQPIFALICHTFGRKFSFHANNKEEAQIELQKWCDHHSYKWSEYHIEPTVLTNDLNDEYLV